MSTATRRSAAIDLRLEAHRVELTGYCYRMLASAFDAEDAVQETMVRAWRALDRFDETKAPLRSWLYAIATNICLDMLRGAKRRARPMDLAPASRSGAALGAPLPDHAWVQPIPDARVLPPAADTDPAALTTQRETVRLAFVAALQHLPPRQRAVLILRDVLCWKATEVARLLDTTVASVNSALQRARTTLPAKDAEPPDLPLDQARQDLVARYVHAFERYDIDALVALLHEDATMSMPPFLWWLHGADEIRRALIGAQADRTCHEARLLLTTANGSPAFGQYQPDGDAGVLRPFALVVLDVSGSLITGTTSYLGAAPLFPLFGLPAQLDS